MHMSLISSYYGNLKRVIFHTDGLVTTQAENFFDNNVLPTNVLF